MLTVDGSATAVGGIDREGIVAGQRNVSLLTHRHALVWKTLARCVIGWWMSR